MLYFHAGMAYFDKPLRIDVDFTDTDSGTPITTTGQFDPPSLTYAMAVGTLRPTIQDIVNARGWRNQKIRIDAVRLIHPDATGSADEQRFCLMIQNLLKQTFPA